MRCQRHCLFRSSFVDAKKNDDDDRQWQQPISPTEKRDFFSLLFSFLRCCPRLECNGPPRGQLPPFSDLFYSIILSAQVKSFWTCLYHSVEIVQACKVSSSFSRQREKGGEELFFPLLRDVKRLNKRIQKEKRETLSTEWKNIRWTDQRSEKKDLSLDGWLCMERLSDERLPGCRSRYQPKPPSTQLSQHFF